VICLATTFAGALRRMGTIYCARHARFASGMFTDDEDETQLTHQAGKPSRDTVESSSQVARARVLVVDDVADNRDLLIRRLRRLGITDVEEAENGQLALEKIQRGHFDLVLLDIMMPVMNGQEVLRRLNAQGLVHDLPVIVISALSDVDDIAACIEDGAEDFLLKPFNRTLLRARVLSCLEKKFLHDHTRRELQRKQAELAEARTLQLALVPPPASVESPLGRLDVDLVLDPAKEVGGDLVDHFLLSGRLLVLLLGDVSDKGAGAALVMARTCALFRALSTRQDAEQLFSNPAQVLAEVNAVLAANNPGCMFVTLLLATLDLTSGRLHYVRAGHIPPFLRRADGTLQRLTHAGGLPLGVEEDLPYTADSVDLDAGDCLLVVTDGISEARGEHGDLFGEERVAQWLAAPRQEPPTVQELLAAVREFEAGAAPSDDVGIILLRLPVSGMPAQSDGLQHPAEPQLPGELLLHTTLAPTPEAVSMLVEHVLTLLPTHGVDTRVAHHAALALDELLTNLRSHGHAATCRVWLALAADRVTLVIEDDAPPFDPRARAAPDTRADVATRPIGGLGAHLVLSVAQGFDYQSASGHNRCTLWFARDATTNAG